MLQDVLKNKLKIIYNKIKPYIFTIVICGSSVVILSALLNMVSLRNLVKLPQLLSKTVATSDKYTVDTHKPLGDTLDSEIAKQEVVSKTLIEGKFVLESEGGSSLLSAVDVKLLIDKETGLQYIVPRRNDSNNIILRVNSDGTPYTNLTHNDIRIESLGSSVYLLKDTATGVDYIGGIFGNLEVRRDSSGKIFIDKDFQSSNKTKDIK